MRQLLEDFAQLFDLDYRVGDDRLGDLLERTIVGLEARPIEDWGTAGSRGRRVTESGRFVSFYYRPHLFPGMDVKLRLAHKLQFSLLPRELPAAAPVSIAAVLESYCHLSGDLFGWEMLRDGKLLVWIVDMSGHGVRAGLASAVLKVLVDNLRERARVEVLVGELNQALHDCLDSRQAGLFATAFFMAIDPSGETVYASAAHPPVLLRRAAGDVQELDRLDRPVGLFGESAFRSRTLRLERGDDLLLYTDGLVEATGRDGEAFGRDRLRALVGVEHAEPANLTAAVFAEFAKRQDIDKLEDDVTFVAVRF